MSRRAEWSGTAFLRWLGEPLLESWRDSWGWLGRRWRALVLSLLLVAGSVILMSRTVDGPWLEASLVESNAERKKMAESISKWGDFLYYTLGLVTALFLLAALRRSAHWRRVAATVLVSAVLAGLVCNLFRAGLGRPRPSARDDSGQKIPDGFYGPRWKPGSGPDNQYLGFPSAHSAVAVGTAVPLAILAPPVGVPLLLVSASIPWSRMALNRHHPSDLLAGCYLGVVFGLAAGLSARKRHATKRPT
ncbi:MAG: phosphatase PAP2 family protein [Verrucomicrobiota bacterium]